MLAFTFTAEHYNGDITRQTPEDKSRLDPLGRSSFYDVLHAASPVKRLSLIGKNHVFTVDLTDGHFEIDGRAIYTQTPPAKTTLEPIYYRKVQQRQQTDIVGELKYLGAVTRYYIGWKTTYRGRSYKYELGID